MPGSTGCFEIYLNDKDGTVVHSKKKGEGKLNEKNAMECILKI